MRINIYSWKFWLVILLLLLVVLRFFKGNSSYDFIGISPISYTIEKEFPTIEKDNEPHLIPPHTSTFFDKTPDLPVEIMQFIPASHVEEPTFLNPSQKRRSKGEEISCKTMEDIYHVPFRTIRPNFLKNPETGYNLEIDCYNEELKIGVEYNGIQHYVYPNVFHKTYEDFIKNVRRDQYKLDACDVAGVYLITVPYNVPHNMIRQYIIDKLPS